jgi:hypothetical protein
MGFPKGPFDTGPFGQKEGSSGAAAIPKSNFQSILADTFQRANTSTGAALSTTGGGNGWIDVEGGIVKISGNTLQLTGDNTDGNQYLRALCLRPVGEAFLNGRIEPVSAAAGWNASGSKGLVLRKQAGAVTYLLGRVQNDGSNLQIYKVIAGAPTLLIGAGTIIGFSTAKTYKPVFEVYDLDCSLTVYDVTGGTPVSAGAISTQAVTGVTTAGVAGVTADLGGTGFVVNYSSITISSKTIIKGGIVGDSIEANTPPGGFISTGEALMLALSVLTGKDYTVTNQAVAGRTSGVALTNINTDIAAFTAAGVTDVFVLLGANDSTNVNAVLTNQYITNMTAIIAALVGAGFKVHLLYNIYADPNGFAGRDYSNETRLQAYNAALPALANGTTCFMNTINPYEYTRANQGTQMFVAADGVHPTNFGQFRLASLWSQGAMASGRF